MTTLTIPGYVFNELGDWTPTEIDGALACSAAGKMHNGEERAAGRGYVRVVTGLTDEECSCLLTETHERGEYLIDMGSGYDPTPGVKTIGRRLVAWAEREMEQPR